MLQFKNINYIATTNQLHDIFNYQQVSVFINVYSKNKMQTRCHCNFQTLMTKQALGSCQPKLYFVFHASVNEHIPRSIQFNNVAVSSARYSAYTSLICVASRFVKTKSINYDVFSLKFKIISHYLT